MKDLLDWHAENCARLMGKQIDEQIMLGTVTPETQAEIDYWNRWAEAVMADCDDEC